MKTALTIITLIPIILLGFSMDMKSGAMQSSFDEFPFYLQYYNSLSIYCFDDLELTDDFIFNDMLSTRSLFHDDYGIIVNIPYMNRNFTIKQSSSNLHYGIGFINSTVSNNVYLSRLYGSLLYNDNNYTIRTHSYIRLQENSPYNYKNSINAVYRNIMINADIDSDDYSAMAGYYGKHGYAAVGYSKNRTIPVQFALNYMKINLMGDIYYDMDSARVEGDIVAIYTMRLGRIILMPLIHFNDSIAAAMGIAYRSTPEITNYLNYMYSSNIISAGIRVDNDFIMGNINAAYNVDDKQYSFDLSVTGNNDFAVMNANMHYDSLLSWSGAINPRQSFFNNNLIPGIYSSYKNNNDLFCALTLKLIDAELFCGAVFYLGEQKYMIKGGMKWYFSENSIL